MQSFRSELEDLNNPVVERDIIDLEKKINLFKNGNIDDDKFRSLRLARGVYGQRQPGVQMVRIKIPYGKLTASQLRRIADISEEYGGGNLHATTRQDIQIHYVSLDKTPELWAKLEQADITLREACGNTVRNVTASPKAGIDAAEPFDVSPYAHELFKFFLRNPVCQEMGRKFKISFSSSDQDTGISFIHDIGFIPKVKIENQKEVRGFRVMIGGGLGAQPVAAQLAYEFLHEDKIIPFTEALLRVFDRYGERKRRVKARFKFLMNDIGLDGVLELVLKEWKSLSVKSYKVDRSIVGTPKLPQEDIEAEVPGDQIKYDQWYKSNVFTQKQDGFFGVAIKLPKGDISAETAHKIAGIVERYAGDDLRVTSNQGYILRFVKLEALPSIFNALNEINLAEPGFDSTADLIACPGTDSCNLGISNSTNVALEFEKLIINEYPDLIHNGDIKIKISGCPNSCGHHGIGSIGFHGSSLKNKKNGKVLPALQVLIGGGIRENGEGFIADKVIKVPSKRGPQVLRYIFDDFEEHGREGEYFADYYRRQGKDYFYQLLKSLANPESLVPDDYIDWGKSSQFAVQTEVGECAGVIIDLVATLVFEAQEKLDWAKDAYENGAYSDSIYHAYGAFINGAKAMLTEEGLEVNTQIGILRDFEDKIQPSKGYDFDGGFKDHVLRVNQLEPSASFAEIYLNDAESFIHLVDKHQNAKFIKEAV